MTTATQRTGAAALAPSRRGFLKGLGAGSLLLGVSAAGSVQSLAAIGAARDSVINHWLHIAADGTVTVFSNAQEMGQGAMSGVAQVLAEEMRLSWDQVRIRTAPLVREMSMAGTDQHWTGGSSSIRGQWETLRKVGAAAREMLVQAGAQRMGVSPADCTAMDGRVVHRPSGRGHGYGELAALAAALPVPESPTLTARGDWRLIGQPLLRKDIPAKVDGSAVFTTDVKMPGLLTATLRQCPVAGGKLVSVDPAPALAVKGVRAVVPMRNVAFTFPRDQGTGTWTLADGVAVVADHWWAAKKGLDALSPVWDTAGNETIDTAAIEARLLADLDAEGSIREWGEKEADIRAAHTAGLARAVETVTIDYAAPYLAHALMEPLSAVAHVRADGVEIWSGSQSPSEVRFFVGALTGVGQDRVTAHVLYSGGGFGRRYINDYVLQAAHLSKEVGAPVKLIWSREEEMAQGRYRPATAARLSAHLGPDGMPGAFTLKFASNRDDQAAMIRNPGFPHSPEYSQPYYWPGSLTLVQQSRIHVPTGPWRAPGSTQNAFYMECFFDELAAKAGVDPVAYRRRYLTGNPRALRVLDMAAAAADWDRPLPPGRGRGIAIWNAFQSTCAQVIEVTLEGVRLSIDRVVCVLDCGTAVNPDSIRAQGEGSIIMGLSATLMEKVEIAGGAVTTTNFDTYPLLGLANLPVMEIVILESPDAPVGGVGEPMVTPVAPALCNAIAAAGGPRLRRLPILSQGLTLA
ncbi:MAG: hypothetical protein RLY86_3017 [Pseudomonadota bacterium]|jgi:isoquinoline 1-oxidoreductase beta subunit